MEFDIDTTLTQPSQSVRSRKRTSTSLASQSRLHRSSNDFVLTQFHNPSPSTTSKSTISNYGKRRRTAYELAILNELHLTPDLKPSRPTTTIMKRQGRNDGFIKKHITTWDDLPFEIQARIASFLTLCDLHVAHSGGLISTTSMEYKNHPFRTMFQTRISEIEPWYHEWRKQKRGHKKRFALTPTEFCSLEKLVLRNIRDERNINLSKGLWNMSRLRSLTIYGLSSFHEDQLEESSETESLSSPFKLPLLRELKLINGSFSKLSTIILTWDKLQRIELSNCIQLNQLPLDMGVKLPRLTYVNITGCEQLKLLPLSMLSTIERNARQRLQKYGHYELRGKKGRPFLELNKEYFDPEYLRQTLYVKRFPHIVRSITKAEGNASSSNIGIDNNINNNININHNNNNINNNNNNNLHVNE